MLYLYIFSDWPKSSKVISYLLVWTSKGLARTFLTRQPTWPGFTIKLMIMSGFLVVDKLDEDKTSFDCNQVWKVFPQDGGDTCWEQSRHEAGAVVDLGKARDGHCHWDQHQWHISVKVFPSFWCSRWWCTWRKTVKTSSTWFSSNSYIPQISH